jgi:hypothetical protein
LCVSSCSIFCVFKFFSFLLVQDVFVFFFSVLFLFFICHMLFLLCVTDCFYILSITDCFYFMCITGFFWIEDHTSNTFAKFTCTWWKKIKIWNVPRWQPIQCKVMRILYMDVWSRWASKNFLYLYSSWPAVSKISNKHVSPSITTCFLYESSTKKRIHEKIQSYKDKLGSYLYSSWPAVSKISNKHVSPSITTCFL